VAGFKRHADETFGFGQVRIDIGRHRRDCGNNAAKKPTPEAKRRVNSRLLIEGSLIGTTPLAKAMKRTEPEGARVQLTERA